MNEKETIQTMSFSPIPRQTPATPRPVIIGLGPAGMFTALALLERGSKPVIFERGTCLEERHADVQAFITRRTLAPESNIQFGEGGAGTYSDGKLFSRPNNSAYATRVLDTFIAFGAPPAIRHQRKPHLGTDVLRIIVANIRNHILAHGGEIHYRSKLTDILICKDEATGVVINGWERFPASRIHLAIGNSARDTFELLHRRGVALESKPISVGVRIEHPVETINLLRHGEKSHDPAAPGAATYSFTHTNRDSHRGAYTFCMCPGGEIVNASSEEGHLALNGMSYAARDSAFSNAAIAVTCTVADYQSDHPLAGIAFQRAIERKAFEAGGGCWSAPAQNLDDFLRGEPTSVLCRNSCKMGAQSADLNALFPAFIGETLRAAFAQWKTESPLFVGEDALLVGPETRTSSPVRICRGNNYESVNVRNIFPVGEGSGYSGGIMSAAIDALKGVEEGGGGRGGKKKRSDGVME